METLQQIFPFYHRSTLEAILDDCNDNILQAVLKISQDILSFPLPFSDREDMTKLRSLTNLFNSNVDKSDGKRPDCCSSPYCPRQMAYDWTQQCSVPNLVRVDSPDFQNRIASALTSQRLPAPDISQPTLQGTRRHDESDFSNYSPQKRYRYDFEIIANNDFENSKPKSRFDDTNMHF